MAPFSSYTCSAAAAVIKHRSKFTAAARADVAAVVPNNPNIVPSIPNLLGWQWTRQIPLRPSYSLYLSHPFSYNYKKIWKQNDVLCDIIFSIFISFFMKFETRSTRTNVWTLISLRQMLINQVFENSFWKGLKKRTRLFNKAPNMPAYWDGKGILSHIIILAQVLVEQELWNNAWIPAQ